MTSDPVFDVQALAQHRIRAARRQTVHPAFLHDLLIDDLELRLSAVSRPFEQAMLVGGLSENRRVKALLEQATGQSPAIVSPEQMERALDPESGVTLWPVQHRPDLVVSLLDFHCINDLPGALTLIRRGMKEDGLLLAALLGSGTLDEMRDSLGRAEIETRGGMSPRVAPFADIRTIGSLLQRTGFALPVVDQDIINVRYSELGTLVGDLRTMAMSNALTARSRAPVTRAFVRSVENQYRANHADTDGKLRATFSVVWLSGWSPGATQPKPLKPGSAKASLAEALAAFEKGKQ